MELRIRICDTGTLILDTTTRPVRSVTMSKTATTTYQFVLEMTATSCDSEIGATMPPRTTSQGTWLSMFLLLAQSDSADTTRNLTVSSVRGMSAIATGMETAVEMTQLPRCAVSCTEATIPEGLLKIATNAIELPAPSFAPLLATTKIECSKSMSGGGGRAGMDWAGCSGVGAGRRPVTLAFHHSSHCSLLRTVKYAG